MEKKKKLCFIGDGHSKQNCLVWTFFFIFSPVSGGKNDSPKTYKNLPNILVSLKKNVGKNYSQLL